jgi:hypothetical protein
LAKVNQNRVVGFLLKIKTFVQDFHSMGLKHSKILKLAAILIFSFELMAPALFACTEFDGGLKTNRTTFNATPHSFTLLSILLFEEVSNEEEREGKDHTLITFSFIEIFNALQKFKPDDITWLLPVNRSERQPSLFTLYRVLLI